MELVSPETRRLIEVEALRKHGLRPNGLCDLDALEMSPAQIAARRLTLNCSELKILAEADPDSVNQLALEKWGEAERDHISDQLNVQSGHHMEKFTLSRAEKELGIQCSRMGEQVKSKRRPWLACTLDAVTPYFERQWVCEAKFFDPRFSLREAIAACNAQVLGAAYVTGAAGTILLIHNHGTKIEAFEYPSDPVATAELLENADRFWHAVQRKQFPFLKPISPPPEELKRVVRIGEQSMTRDLAWVQAEDEWVSTKEAAERHKDAAERLKAMVPDDKQRVFGRQAEIRVSKSGARTLTLLKTPPTIRLTEPAAAAA